MDARKHESPSLWNYCAAVEATQGKEVYKAKSATIIRVTLSLCIRLLFCLNKPCIGLLERKRIYAVAFLGCVSNVHGQSTFFR